MTVWEDPVDLDRMFMSSDDEIEELQARVSELEDALDRERDRVAELSPYPSWYEQQCAEVERLRAEMAELSAQVEDIIRMVRGR